MSIRISRSATHSLMLLFLIFLSGCYESETDLIGGNAEFIEKLDTILIFNNKAYYSRGSGQTVTLCELATKQDFDTKCKFPKEMKIERTTFGNYVVQIKSSQKYNYLLFTRSDPANLAKSGAVCAMWLGDRIVGDDLMAIVSKGRIESVFGDPAFNQIRKDLALYPQRQIESRDQLQNIVRIYETRTANVTIDKWPCLGSVVHFTPKNLVVRGDNRHLPDFIN